MKASNLVAATFVVLAGGDRLEGRTGFCRNANGLWRHTHSDRCSDSRGHGW